MANKFSIKMPRPNQQVWRDHAEPREMYNLRRNVMRLLLIAVFTATAVLMYLAGTILGGMTIGG